MSTSLPTHPRRAEARAAVRQALDQVLSAEAAPAPSQAPQTLAAVLDCVTGVLAAAAEHGDGDLAQVCRGVLDALPGTPPLPDQAATGDGSGEPTLCRGGACARGGTRLPRPNWAARSIPEDGGVVHETVSPLRPTIVQGELHGWDLVPTEVSISTTDLHIDGRWIRTRPTVQIEGGSYSLDGARQLWTILGGFLAALDADGLSAAS